VGVPHALEAKLRALRRPDLRARPRGEDLDQGRAPHQPALGVGDLSLGKGKLADEFDISRTECKECLGTLLTLVPKKPDARFREVQLDIDPKTAQVRRSIVVDPDGSRNVITFSGLKTNVGLSKDTFQLTPPPGTQIIDTTAAR
jgi:outer membrane lipoprotein carrier protein